MGRAGQAGRHAGVDTGKHLRQLLLGEASGWEIGVENKGLVKCDVLLIDFRIGTRFEKFCV